MKMKMKMEITEIRDMVARVYNDTATHEEQQKVYKMFGNINWDNASGIVQGINMVLFNTVPVEGVQG